ncbi:butyrophilin subfamily 3 member A2-like isoform X1 [Caretta caretta]|uniref:butyrophilin subfamily 3 member A2-like isoform X1 n=1 Tax=Caretta caretta TaxID=8467 RepID=UPI003F4C5061
MKRTIFSFFHGFTVSSSLPGYVVFFIALHIHNLASAQFTVTGPDHPITTSVGGEAVLPCHLSPRMSAENMEVRWFRFQYHSVVHLYQEGQDKYEEQMLEYHGRTELLKDGITNGSVSLRIYQVQLSDHGQYTCFFQYSIFYEEAILELMVSAMGSDPHISVDGHQDGGILVVCQSAGWHPEPEVQWKDHHGKLLSPASEKISKETNGLFQTQISIVITEDSNRNLSCSVRNPLVNQEKISTVFIAELFFPRVNPWMVALGVILALLALLIALASYCFWRQHRMKEMLRSDLARQKEEHREEKGKLFTELGLGLRRAQLYAGTVHKTDTLFTSASHLPLRALSSFPQRTRTFISKARGWKQQYHWGWVERGRRHPRFIAEQGRGPFGKGLISDEMLPPCTHIAVQLAQGYLHSGASYRIELVGGTARAVTQAPLGVLLGSPALRCKKTQDICLLHIHHLSPHSRH